MTKVLFKKVNIVDSRSPFNGKTVDVLISDGKIESVGEGLTAKGATVVEGGSLSPGWVDTRVRLTVPGSEWKEDLPSLAAGAIAGGFTRLVCLPNTEPALDSRDFVESFLSRTQRLPVHFHPYGALSHGGKGDQMAELFDMHQAGAVGFTNGIHSIQASGTVIRALQYLSSFGGLLVNYPHDDSLSRGGFVNEGPVSTRLGLKGTPTIAEEIMLARDLKLMEYYEHRLHIAPVTTAGAVELLRDAKKRFSQLTAETSAMYLFLTDEVLDGFDSNYKVFPPLRSEADREALIKGVQDGVIEVISSFHWPEGTEEKRLEFPAAEFGMSGLQTCFSLAYETLVDSGAITLAALVDTLTHNPRRILQLPAVSIEVDAEAELTWFDENGSWTPTTQNWKSKSLNSPFLGKQLKGCVKGIFAKGELTIC